MYKTTQSNVVEWPSHHLESRVIRPQSEEQPTCSQGQPNESVHGPLEEIEEERQRKKIEQMAFNRRNKPEDKRKKRLAAQAERSRLRRMKETEERRLERLANDTERRKSRRSTETEEQRLLRLRSLADVRRKQRAQNNNLLKQYHSSQEKFSANSREVLEENVTGNPSDVAHNDASVAFSTQEATTERLNTSEDEFQHNASVPHLDESASKPLPSTSAYVPLKDLTIQPLHDEYVLLTPDPALKVVESLFENKMARAYDRLPENVRKWIRGFRSDLSEKISAEALDFMKAAESLWSDYCQQMASLLEFICVFFNQVLLVCLQILIRNVFLYLDRTFILDNIDESPIWESSLVIFREEIVTYGSVLKKLDGILECIAAERAGDQLFFEKLSPKRSLRVLTSEHMADSMGHGIGHGTAFLRARLKPKITKTSELETESCT
ncbi:unnamed protein product [Cylicocyclus nassatus]|uniref:Cullin N-terminal domain-containing protein n=1 Tax=Cylicocyclus nassatus TaxID=53992 RepID=A0AA36M1N0_CYLNA|nr:unnamed protein product [Cylicocyclus nassatus]